MVEQEAVNFEVAGSSPAAGATRLYQKTILYEWFFIFDKRVRLNASRFM